MMKAQRLKYIAALLSVWMLKILQSSNKDILFKSILVLRLFWSVSSLDLLPEISCIIFSLCLCYMPWRNKLNWRNLNYCCKDSSMRVNTSKITITLMESNFDFYPRCPTVNSSVFHPNFFSKLYLDTLIWLVNGYGYRSIKSLRNYLTHKY